MYHAVWIVHLVLSVTIMLNHYFAETLGVARVTLNTLAMLGYVVFLVHICVTQIFPNKEAEEVGEEGGTEMEVEPKQSAQAIKWTFWMQIEVLIFCANIISNMLFILFRSFSRSKIHIALDREYEKTDLLEEQQVLIGICSSYFVPLIVTICLMNSKWDEYLKAGMVAIGLTKVNVIVQLL